MELMKLTERIWVFSFEAERDRPNLGYIRGDRWSLAVDAGHSEDHLTAFYRALVQEGLPLPEVTVLTHWHWDHTFAMHAVHGLTIASEKTGSCLLEAQNTLAREGRESFLQLDESVRLEYPGDTPMIITQPDLLYQNELLLDAGNCPIRLFEAVSPHTDDSTLIEVPGEKALFLGDATGGVFPTWKRDAALSRELASTVSSSASEIFILGHCEPLTKEETVQILLEEEA